MSNFTDTVSIWTSLSHDQTKVWASLHEKPARVDGKNPKHYSVTTREVSGVVDMANLVYKLQNNPKVAITRDPFTQGKSERTERNGQVTQQVPQHNIVFDFDQDVEINAAVASLSPDDMDEVMRDLVRAKLPQEFHESSFVWQLSSSAGHPLLSNQLKCHLWFWSETPYSGDVLHEWVKTELPGVVDAGIYNRAQLIYTASPVMGKGLTDPIEHRIGVSQGLSDTVPLVINLKPKERKADKHSMSDPRQKDGAIGAYCRAVSPRQFVQESPEMFTWTDEGKGRLTWHGSASGAKDSAFITDDELHIHCTSDSWPFASPANVFDLLQLKCASKEDEGFESFGNGANHLKPSFKAALQIAKEVTGYEPNNAEQKAEPGAVIAKGLSLLNIADNGPLEFASEFVINGFIQEGLTLISGTPGAGKTTNIVPLACVAAGIAPQGAFNLSIDEWRNVVYFTESDIQVRTTLHAYRDLLEQAEKEELGRRFTLVNTRRFKPEELNAIIQACSATYKRTLPNGSIVPPLIVIDTNNASFDLESENDAAEVGKLIDTIKTAARAQNDDLSIWLITHTAKSAKKAKAVEDMSARGSGAFEGDVNQTLYLIHDTKTGMRRLEIGKRRFNPKFDVITFSQHSVSHTVTRKRTGEMDVETCLVGLPVVSNSADYRAAADEAKLKELQDHVVEALKLEGQTTPTLLAKQLKVRYDTLKPILHSMALAGVIAINPGPRNTMQVAIREGWQA